MRRGPGLVGMAARTAVVAGTATAVSGRVARRQQQKYAGQAAEQQAAAAPPPAVDEDDPMLQVQKLAELHAAGTLTDEEFAAAKAKVLGI
ncbi:MAG TPA: SHOCT domain-containing protein [Actinomycetota bacterium]|nr:SHOCT domain-containing protein [Actinomycetota bacterium]